MLSDKRLTKTHRRILAVLLTLALVLGTVASFGVTESFAVEPTITISGKTVPTTLKKGQFFTVKGTIKCSVTITRVRVGILKTDGTWLYKYDNKSVNAKTFDVNKADSKMSFSKLANGTYYYRILVTPKGGTEKKLVNAKFTVGTVSSSTNTATLSGANYPTKLEKGLPFTVKGTIKDTKKIKKVKIGIVDTKGTWRYTYKNYTVNAKTFDVNKADSKMSFSKLPNGTYYYRIYAADSAGWKRLLSKKFTVEETFEAFMTSQGFPESYKPYLRKLHIAHPTWKFYAQKTNVKWDTAVSKEYNNKDNYVSTSSPWYMKVSDTVYDGGWNLATKKTIAYYMDPRNFLTEQDIYQFLDQRAGKGTGGSANTARLFNSNSSCSWNTSSYIDWINTAGANNGVKPNVTAAMIIMEQGWNGAKNGLVSGTYTTKLAAPMDKISLKGYYNYFNVGAYSSSIGLPYCSTKVKVNATQRGLWYAAGQPNSNGVRQASSYGRPWNTRAKAINGGTKFYSENYVQQNQYTYYTKKFNVIPPSGTSFGDHQYMTNVDGANGEGNLLRRSYAGTEKNMQFRIPVYTSMPTKNCPKPTEKNH